MIATVPTMVGARHASPLGSLELVLDDRGRLLVLEFASGRATGDGGFPAFEVPEGVGAALDAYFGGDLRALDALEICPSGSPFRLAVWWAVRAIPAGTTTTYGSLAASLGRPAAARAVGRANGANPLAIVVPCHRVVGTDGSLTGYAGGLERKRWLLEHERRWSAGRG